MEQKNDIGRRLSQADAALQEGDWEGARNLYRQILDQDSGNLSAEQGMARIAQLETVDQTVRDLIQRGDDRLAAGDYPAARDDYTDALNNAGQQRILKYHAELESKRNLARALVEWQERVNQARVQARAEVQAQRWDAASAVLTGLLQELPEAPPYEALARQLREARNEVEGTGSVWEKYNKAKAAYDQEDFEEAKRLATQIQAGTAAYSDALRLLGLVKESERYIEPAMERANAAYEQQRWEDAFAELDELRSQFPKNPAWRKLWLQVGTAYGQQELDAGRQANACREFETAHRHFDQGGNAFHRVFEVYETHALARRLQIEAEDLTKIALVEKQAQLDWEAGRRSQAVAALQEAQRRIDHARLEQRDYAAVAATVNSMVELLNRELERIQGEEQRLQEGELHLKNRRLEPAERCFRETLNALQPEQQRRAADGLQRTHEEQQKFQADMERGRQAGDPAEAVTSFQAAYDRWPAGPEAFKALELALVEAGERAYGTGNDKKAAEYFMRALELNPENRRAQAGLEKPNVVARVQVRLEQVQDQLHQLIGIAETGTADLRKLETVLETARNEAQPYPEVRAEVDTLLAAVRDWVTRWQLYENAARQAKRARQDGRWEEAAAALRQSVSAFDGRELPRWLIDQIGRGEQAAQLVQAAQTALPGLLQQARQAYGQLLEPGKLNQAQAALQESDRLWQRAGEAATAAGGELPPDLRSGGGQLSGLKERVEIALEAATAPAARDGLLLLRKVLRLQGSDPALEALAGRLQSEVQGEVPQLLSAAEREREAGNLTEALELLRQARDLDPDNADVSARYAGLFRQQRLEDRLREADTAVTQQINGASPADARDTLRRALELLLDPEVALPRDVRGWTQELFYIHSLEEGLAFGRPQFWQTAQDLLHKLGQAGEESWAGRRLFELVDRWARIARDIALEGVVGSETSLKNFQGAYEAARTYYLLHLEDEKALAGESETRELLIGQLVESAAKRLDRARLALEAGGFSVAREELEAVETKFFGPVASKFPGLLDRVEKVEAQQAAAEQLRRQIQQLEQLYTQVKPRLDAAQQSFVEGRLGEAAQELAALPDLAALPALNQQAEELRRRLGQTRVRQAQQQVADVLLGIQVNLRLASDTATLELVFQQLQGLPQQMDWEAVPAEQKEQYYQLADQIREQREQLAAGATYEAQAAQAEQAGDYVGAVKVLQKALAGLRDGVRRAELELRLDKLQPLAEQQRQHQAALDAGRAALADKNYAAAARFLRQVREGGAPGGVEERLLNAARAGMAFQEAQRLWQEAGDSQGARIELEAASRLAEGNPEAEEVSSQMESFRRRLESQQQIQGEIRKHLNAARQALSSEALDRAREEVQAVFERQPEQKEAQELLYQIEKNEQAQRMFHEAVAARDAGKHESALALVRSILETVLPGYPRALAFQQEIERGRDANVMLMLARTRAEKQEFVSAREALEEAVRHNADPERVSEMQKIIAEQERKWAAEMIDPIQEAYRDRKYSEALEKCEQALGRVTTAEYKDELGTWQSNIVNRWVDEALRSSRQRSSRASDEDLSAMAIEMDRLARFAPQLAADLARALSNFRREVHTERLRRRLEGVRRQLEAPESWEPSLMICDEVREEAKGLGLGGVDYEASRLRMQVEERRDHAITAALRQERDRRVQAARAVVVRDRRDFDRVLELARQVFEVKGCEEDGEASGIIAETREALKVFEATEAALQKCVEDLRLRRYEDSKKALEKLTVVSPLLQDSFVRLQQLTDTLLQAERDQDAGEWELALVGYRSALEQAGALEAARNVPQSLEMKRLLDRSIGRCCAHLMRGMLDEAARVLESARPDVGAARAVLERAEAAGWVTSEFEKDVRRLRRQLASCESLNQAVGILTDGAGDPAAALDALREARGLLPEGFSGEVIAQWEIFARAAAARQCAELQPAIALLEQLVPPVANEARVQQLVREVRDSLAMDQLFEELQSRVRRSLDAQPPQYEAAAALVRQFLIQPNADSHPRVLPLVQSLREQIQSAFDRARQAGDYESAFEIGRAWTQLCPDDPAVQSVVAGLPGEQKIRMDEMLRQAETALKADQLVEANAVLENAARLTSSNGDSRITTLKRQVDERGEFLKTLDARLGEISVLVRREEWPGVVEKLREISSTAPEYAPLLSLIGDVQRQIYGQAVYERDARRFEPALNLIQLGLSLGRPVDLLELEQEIRALRELQVEERRKEAREALELWDLDTARIALDRALVTLAGDSESLRLQARLETMRSHLGEIEREMEGGWKALQARDYLEAQQCFERLLERVPYFKEAQAWRDYGVGMSRAVQSVETEAFMPAVNQFEAAEGVLRIGKEQRLTPVLGGEVRLREKRRQAAYDAFRLRLAARELVVLDRRSQQLSDMQARRDLIWQIINEKERFSRLHSVPVTPPDDFNIEGPVAATEPAPAYGGDAGKRAGDRLQEDAAPSAAMSPLPVTAPFEITGRTGLEKELSVQPFVFSDSAASAASASAGGGPDSTGGVGSAAAAVEPPVVEAGPADPPSVSGEPGEEVSPLDWSAWGNFSLSTYESEEN